jgi:hypothetical protein
MRDATQTNRLESSMTNPAIGARILRARALRPALAAAALVVAAACSTDRILKVDRPDIIEPSSLGNTAGADAQYAGVIGDMSNMLDGSLGLNSTVGLFTDELQFGATPPEIRQFDQRALPESNTLVATLYRNMQQLRGQADRAADAITAVKPDDPRIGEMTAISAFMHIALAENFCSGVPIGSPGENADPLTTAALYQAAVAKLDAAAGAAGSDARTKNLIAVLRGRLLLDVGQFDQAAAAVASVPTTFTYTTFHGIATDYQKNGYYDYMWNSDGLLVSEREGTNGYDFATAGDPRVPIEGDGSPSRFDGTTPRYYLKLYSDYTSPSIVASGVEARLIEAEAALRASDATTFMAKLNAARASFAMAPLGDPGSLESRVDLLFRERAFSLFGTAHRLSDLRREVRQYGRGAEAVFPTGAYHKDGLTFGTDVQFVIPQTEKNNPNFKGCLDRNP